MNQLGSMVLPRLRFSGDNGDCGGRYLDIKDKRRWGYTKTGTPVPCELASILHGTENGRARSRLRQDGTVLTDGCDTI